MKNSFKMMMMMMMMMVVLLVLAVSSPLTAFAENLSATQKALLETNSIPLYLGSDYLTEMTDDKAVVMWFWTIDSPDKVMDWYKNKLSSWLELQANGSRLLYKGPGKIEAKDVPTKSYIFARTKDEETPDSKHTEIVIRILK